jgi:hypothetical protein
MATEAARKKMRESWTPERRAAQAARAKAIPEEARVRGGMKGAEYARTPEARAQRQMQAIKQYSNPEARRRHQAIALKCMADPEWRQKWEAGMRAALHEYWTPPRRQERSMEQRKVKRGWVAWPPAITLSTSQGVQG